MKVELNGEQNGLNGGIQQSNTSSAGGSLGSGQFELG
jgi:hypothetical protein